MRHDATGEGMEEFGALLVERADDLGIAMRPEFGYLAAWRRLLAVGQARLLLAEHDGDLLGGLLLNLQGALHSTAYSADRAASRRQFPGTTSGALDGDPRGTGSRRAGRRAGRPGPARSPSSARS